MQIPAERVDKVVILGPAGRLDVSNAAGLGEQVGQLLAAGDRTLLIDLTDVGYLSSIGLAACLKSGKLAQAAGARLALCGLQALVQNVFEVSGFLRLFEVHDSRQEALAALGPSPGS